MHIEQGAQFGRCIGCEFLLKSFEFVDHGVARLTQSVYFCSDLIVLNEIVRNVNSARSHQHRTPNGNASGNC